LSRLFLILSLEEDVSQELTYNYLETIKPITVTTKQDHSGPYATTGTNEFIDKYDISKLQAKNPDTNKFIMDNITEIYKGLQKIVYKHPLGYYTFKGSNISGKYLELSLSNTTYYN
jgi:hypothetical protein